MGLPICAIDGPERKRRRLDGETGLEVSDTDDLAFKDDVASSSTAPVVPSAPRLALWATDMSSDSETSEEDDVRPFAASLQSFTRALPRLHDSSVLQPWRLWDHDDDDEEDDDDETGDPNQQQQDSQQQQPQLIPRPRRRTLLTLPLRRRNAFRVSSTSSSRELDSEIDHNRSTAAELLRRINASSHRSPPPPQISESHLMSELSEFVPGGTLSAEVADMYRQGMVSAQEAAYLSRSGSEEQQASDHVSSDQTHLTHVSDSRATTPLRSSTPLMEDSNHPESETGSSGGGSRLARLEADFERLETERRMRDFDAIDSHYGPMSSTRPTHTFMDHPPDAHLGDLTSPRITITDQLVPPTSMVAETEPLLSRQQMADTAAARQTVHFELASGGATDTSPVADPAAVTEFHSGASIDSDSNRSLPSEVSPSGHVSFGSVSFAADTADLHSSSEPGESPESPQVLPIEDTLVIPFTRSPSPYEYPVSPASSIDYERRDYNRRRSRSLECLEEGGGRRGRSRGGSRGGGRGGTATTAAGRAAYASDPEPDVPSFPQSGEIALRRSNSLPFSARRQSVGSQSEPESSMRRSRSQSTGSDRRVRFRLAVRFQ